MEIQLVTIYQTNDEEPRMRGEVRAYLVEGDVSDEEAARVLAGDTLEGRAHLAYEHHNLITNTFRQRVAQLITASSTSGFVVPGWIGLGTSAVTPAASDTSLTGETYRKACATVATLSTYYARFVANFTTTETSGTFLGMGLFSSSSGGDMDAIVSVSVSKTTTTALVAEWRCLISSA